MLKRLTILNQTRQSVKTNLVSQKQKEANDRLKKHEDRLNGRVTVLSQEIMSANNYKQIARKK